MCVCGRALLKRLIRSVVNPAAIPDHSVSCWDRGAADPDEQAAVHSKTSNAALQPVKRRERRRDDVVVREPLSRERSRIIRELTRFAGTMTIDDKWGGCTLS